MNTGILSIICIYSVSLSILFISHGNGIYVATVDMAMSNARYKLLGGGQYPSEYDEDAPVPPALPVPFYRCEPGNQLAVVKQSRRPKTAGRAFYVCKWNDLLNPCHCFFFQWIDSPDKFDPRIWLFPYYPSESWPYNEFRRWVPPPQIQHL